MYGFIGTEKKSITTLYKGWLEQHFAQKLSFSAPTILAYTWNREDLYRVDLYLAVIGD